jgi:hypothetical protein
MDACAACGTKVEDGLTKCPQCGAKLSRPGSFTQVFGWVTVVVSLIPFAVAGVVTRQGNFLPLVVGLLVLGAGVACIMAGRIAMHASPPTTRPLPAGGSEPAEVQGPRAK